MRTDALRRPKLRLQAPQRLQAPPSVSHKTNPFDPPVSQQFFFDWFSKLRRHDFRKENGDIMENKRLFSTKRGFLMHLTLLQKKRKSSAVFQPANPDTRCARPVEPVSRSEGVENEFCANKTILKYLFLGSEPSSESASGTSSPAKRMGEIWLRFTVLGRTTASKVSIKTRGNSKNYEFRISLKNFKKINHCARLSSYTQPTSFTLSEIFSQKRKKFRKKKVAVRIFLLFSSPDL